MKNVCAGLVVAALLAVVVFAGSTLAAVALEVQEGNGLNAAPAREPINPADAAKDDDPKVEQPKTDEPKKEEPKKEEPKVRVDPKAVLVNNALTAIAAAEKAVAEGNKEVAAAELAKAKTALEALQKAMLRDKLRENMEFKSLDGARNIPAKDARPQEKRTRYDGDENSP